MMIKIGIFVYIYILVRLLHELSRHMERKVGKRKFTSFHFPTNPISYITFCFFVSVLSFSFIYFLFGCKVFMDGNYYGIVRCVCDNSNKGTKWFYFFVHGLSLELVEWNEFIAGASLSSSREPMIGLIYILYDSSCAVLVVRLPFLSFDHVSKAVSE
jgi:hypothetical protein